MVQKLFLCSIFTVLILEISSPLEIKAAHKNNLINKFCIASLKSKLKFKNKQKLNEISHYVCECFLKEYNSGNSIKGSRIHCRDIASKKYNL